MSDNLPANIMDLAKGLQQSASVAASGGAGLYMKFAKGDWTYGAEETDVEDKSEWAIHPEGFQHGWIAWGDKAHGNKGQKLGEDMVPATHAMPAKANLPEVDGEWDQQVAMQMLCVSGADEGTAVVFNTCSVGGRSAYQGVLVEIVKKIQANDPAIAPIVTLSKDSYKHKEHGKVYTPEIVVLGWETLETLNEWVAEYQESESAGMLEADDPVEEAEPAPVVEEVVEEKDEPSPANTRKRNRAAAKEAKAEEPVPAATTSRRRRRK